MKIRKLLFALLCCPLWTLSQQLPEQIFNLSYRDDAGKQILISDVAGSRATAFVFMLADCPACQSYSLTLNKLSKKYADKGIRFVGIFPGTYSSREEVSAFRKDYRLAFPVVLDPENELTRRLKARIAPEVMLVNEKGITVYRGRIDDWMYAVGKKRTVITRKDLELAIKSVISNDAIEVSETNAIGCILEYE
jgi:peroxiredoxin